MTRLDLTPHQFVRWFAVDRVARAEFRDDLRAQLRTALAADRDRGHGRPRYAEISHRGVTVEGARARILCHAPRPRGYGQTRRPRDCTALGMCDPERADDEDDEGSTFRVVPNEFALAIVDLLKAHIHHGVRRGTDDMNETRGTLPRVRA